MKKIFFIIYFILTIISCTNKIENNNQLIQKDDSEIAKEVSDSMEIEFIPKLKIGEKSYINCLYKKSLFPCGHGEIYFIINDSLNFERALTDTTYNSYYCGCYDTIIVPLIDTNQISLEGILLWNCGDWTYGKPFNEIIKAE